MLDPILEKIKKLLRMKRGGTPDEVATAMALAAELARKYGINLDSVDPEKEPDQPVGSIDAITSARLQWECKYAALICQGFFNVNAVLRDAKPYDVHARMECYLRGKPYRRGYKIILVGTERDTQIALYVYSFLVAHFRREWKRHPRLRNRQAFFYGMYIGLCSKLDEQKQAQLKQAPAAALVLLDRGLALREQWIKDNVGEVRDSDTTPGDGAAAAKNAGFIAGRNTEIHQGISATKPLALIGN
jgi:hypothetical protein